MAFRQRLQRRHYGRTKVGLPKSKFDEATLRSEPGLIFFANNGAKGPFNDHLHSSASLGAKAGKTRWLVSSVVDGVWVWGGAIVNFKTYRSVRLVFVLATYLGYILQGGISIVSEALKTSVWERIE